MNQQVKAGISAVKDLLAGRSGEAKAAAHEEKATREVVAAELPAAISGRSPDEASPENAEGAPGSDTQEIPRLDSKAAEEPAHGDAEETAKAKAEAMPPSKVRSVSRKKANSENSNEDEQKRARELFLDPGYFDETVQDLRAADSPAQRAAAARALGLFGSQRGTAHLIAAMFDDDPDVRSAAEEALSRIGDWTVADVPVNAVSNNEIAAKKSDKVSPVQSATADAVSSATSVEQGAVQDVAQVERAGSEAAEVASPDTTTTVVETETPVSQTDAALTSAPDPAATNTTGIGEEEHLLLEEHRIREEVEGLGLHLLETAAARKKAEQEVQWRTEREVKLRNEAAAQRSKEERLRKRADGEAERRRVQEQEAVAAELEARIQAESEAQRLVDEEISLRLKTTGLRQTGEELARQRLDKENARREAAEAARQAEATSARNAAKSLHDAELDQLHSEEEGLRRTTEEIALHSAEVEIAREKADAESERLVEAQARMRAAEDARARAEAERSQLEIEIHQKVETQLRMLEETRRRGQEEQERLQEETHRQATEEQRRLGELETMKATAEEESRQRAEQERQILSQVDSLRIADAEARKRITDAEVRRRAAEDACRLVAEKVQRVEAEAHARAKEEEQMMAKLETERRTVAGEAQSRAAQEKRIREEIELFRRLEDQERPRIEEATLQRAAAEARLRERRGRLKAEEDARASAEEQLNAVDQHRDSSSKQPRTSGAQEKVNETFAPATLRAADEVPGAPAALPSAFVSAANAENETFTGDEVAVSSITPAIVTYLNSVDPYKRAAAVAELARSRPEDAFSLIANCFDDHSPHVRNAAARALRKLEPARTVDLFNRALEEASPDRRRNIGSAIAASGVATEAINNLVSESREDTYNALSLLFVMAKTGEVAPLEQALEEHQEDEIGRAVMKLLTLSGHGKQ